MAWLQMSKKQKKNLNNSEKEIKKVESVSEQKICMPKKYSEVGDWES